MNEVFTFVLQQIQDLGPLVFLVFLRVGASVALLPLVGEQAVPLRIKLASAVALTLILWPMVRPFYSVAADGASIAAMLGPEVVAGLLLGLCFRLFVQALQIAGTIAGSSTSLAQVFGGGVGVDPQPAIGNTLMLGALALIAMSGLHVRYVEAFLLSYDALPAGTWPRPEMVKSWSLSEVSSAFSLAFVLASPFLVAALLYNLALGVINRAMPQLMVSFVGAPALTLGGLAIGALSIPFLLAVWWSKIDLAFSDPFRFGY